MAKTRVHELAKEFGVESKFVLEKLKEMGEFVKSASSTVEPPVEMRFKKQYGDELKASAAAAPAAETAAEAPAAKKASPKPGPKPAVAAAAPEAPAEAPVGGVRSRREARPQARPPGACRRARGPGRRACCPRRTRGEGAVPGSPPGRSSRRPAPRQQPVRSQPGHGLAPCPAHPGQQRRHPSAAPAGRRRGVVPACLAPTRR